MVKMIGLIMIVGSCSAVGISVSGRLSSRARALAGFIAAFQIIKAEIVYRAAPMADILEIIGERCGGPAADFLRSKSRRVSMLKGYGLLDADIRHISSALGVLGRYDAATQAEAINLAVRGLENELAAARAESAHKGRLYRALGVTAGIMIALIVV